MFKMFKKLYNMAGEDKKKIRISFVLQFVDTMLSFVPLGALLMFFQHVIDKAPTDGLWLTTLGLLLGSVIVRIFSRYYMDKNQFSSIYKMFYSERIRVADHLKKVNMGFFTDDNVGNVTTTLVNGMSFIEEQCMNSLIEVFTSVINMTVLTLMLFALSPIQGIIFLLTVVAVTLLLIPYQKKSIEASKDHNMANETLTSAIIEYVKNISVIKSFHLIGKHERSNNAFVTRRRVDLDSEKINIPYIVGSMCVMAIGSALMIYFSVKDAQTGSALPLYNAVILAVLALYVFRALTSIVLKLGIINIANDSLESIEKLYREKELTVKGDKKPKDNSIEFQNVTFAYDEKPVIDGISFKLKEHTMNALVGLSGSGKSTLVNLIPRFFEIQKGKILIGGVDVREMSQETLYGCVSMVFQNVYLFKDTLYNNIAFGNDNATKEDVIEACKKAKCYDFIMALPQGFDTMVGEAGLSLSGGERQRVSIARAILKDAPIILLDEATASVDPDNELDIQEAINALVANKTILVIAHKLSCVKNANNILVIDEGKLLQEGTHDSLLEKGGLYASLWAKRTNSKSWKIAN